MEDFIKNELSILEQGCKDEESLRLQKVVTNDILDIYKVFRKQKHTGFSASYIIGLLERLLRYLPVTPLTGQDDEWEHLDYGESSICFQNKRCPQIFKDKDGKCFNVEGRVFSDDNGHTWFTNGDSKVYITFPYTVPLTPEYVIIPNQEYRSNILSQLTQIISQIDTHKDINISDITEDTLITDIFSLDKCSDFMDTIKREYGISQNYIIDDTSKMWSLVTYVLHNIE